MGAYDDKLNLVLFESLKLDKPWTMQTYRSIGGYDVWEKTLKEKPTRESIIDGVDRKSTRLNSSHPSISRMPSSA